MVVGIGGFIEKGCNFIHSCDRGSSGQAVVYGMVLGLVGFCAIYTFFSASGFLGQRWIVVTCPCPQLEHVDII